MATAAEIATYMAWNPHGTVLWLVSEPEDRRLASFYLKEFLAQPLHVPGHASIPGIKLKRSNVSEVMAENDSRTFINAIRADCGRGLTLNRIYVPQGKLDPRRTQALQEFIHNTQPVLCSTAGSLVHY